MKRLLAFLRKEFLLLKADPLLPRLMIAAPILQLLVLGYALTFETAHVKTAILDLDRSPASRALEAALEASDRFDLAARATSLDELEELIEEWEVKLGIYIPPDFSRDLQRGQARVLCLLDAVDGTQAFTAYTYFEALAAQTFPQVGTRPVVREGTATVHYWYNPLLKSQVYMIPGLVILIVTMVSLLLGALSLVREKEQGTLDQLLVSPLSPLQILTGTLFPFLLYSLVELSLAMTAAWAIFGTLPRGGILPLFLVVTLYLFTTLGLALLISTISHTQTQALFFAWFAMVVLILLSGFLIPVANMPQWLKTLTLLNPLRYMMTVVRELYIKGAPLSALWREVLALGGLGILVMGVAAARFGRSGA
ncbi:ABC transporter permease [Spirochaeta thermophila]|uniref:Transport permease protein n=1 Tax=Winmispira thermophila (strain ATCC 49972 / DSM 6192 / RI 19.B1) TaxID=665571 RepID=E0RQB8_WINT6|nr:ABC transporter permease [Spirochaeta thermophila]ADN02894.1 transporter [Spirochaeta thermophila DSM 6192]